MEDWKRRLEEMRVPFQEFDPHNPRSVTGTHNIVLVSPDKATFESWPQIISEINEIRPVVRLIADESHLWFTDNDLRAHALSNPSALRLFPMQVVLLSATVPPAAERWLTEQFALVNPSIIRGLSHRPELKMVFLTGYENVDDMVDALDEYLTRVKEELEWGEKDRFLAYANYHNVAQSIADKCGIEIYQASDGSKRVELAKRRAIYDRLKSGERPGLVATTALSAGTDYPHIRVSCHVGMPFDLVTFVQQASRAGRDGKPAHCVILATQGSTSSKAHLNHLRGVQEMKNMVFGSKDTTDRSPRCARWHIGNFLDGQGFTCRDFGPEWQVCSMCEAGKYNRHT
jgi:superfamily II DNA helicase RecQ